MRLSFLGWWSLAGMAAAAGPATHDGLRIVVRESFPAGMSETTEYVASDRARTEWRASSTASGVRAAEHGYVHLRRCDLDKMVILNAADRTYRTAPLQIRMNVIERAAFSFGRHHTPPPGTPEIVVETTTVDTGERKIAFGRSARRVVTTRRQIQLRDSERSTEIVTDGWYIDLETRTSCERTQEGRGRAVLIAVASPANGRTDPPRVAFKDIGTPEKGFAVDTRTMFRFAGPESSRHSDTTVTQRVVTHLSREALDASLFEIPPGFRSADGMFGTLAARLSRTAHIVRSVVASWFR